MLAYLLCAVPCGLGALSEMKGLVVRRGVHSNVLAGQGSQALKPSQEVVCSPCSGGLSYAFREGAR